MFLKLTLYYKEEDYHGLIMVNMDNVTYYIDTYELDKKYDEETKRFIENKTFTGCLIEFGNEKTVKVAETMEEINLKMAQLERRNNGNSNRKG